MATEGHCSADHRGERRLRGSSLLVDREEILFPQVDPLKVANLSTLEAHRRRLTSLVEAVWGRIIQSAAVFPPQLRAVFASLRQRMMSRQRPEQHADTLVSSSLFLRFICPAVMSPSLFNLVCFGLFFTIAILPRSDRRVPLTDRHAHIYAHRKDSTNAGE